MKTRTKFYTLENTIYGYNHLDFCHVDGLMLRAANTCKESFISDLNDMPDKVALAFRDEKHIPRNLNVLNSFAQEFNLPESSILELTKNFCVVRVPAKWRTNWSTFGLFLILFRASMDDRRSWRKCNDGDLREIKNLSAAKIKALWHPNIARLMDACHYGNGEFNCMYYLCDFDTHHFIQDSDMSITMETIKLVSWAVKFENL